MISAIASPDRWWTRSDSGGARHLPDEPGLFVGSARLVVLIVGASRSSALSLGRSWSISRPSRKGLLKWPQGKASLLSIPRSFARPESLRCSPHSWWRRTRYVRGEIGSLLTTASGFGRSSSLAGGRRPGSRSPSPSGCGHGGIRELRRGRSQDEASEAETFAGFDRQVARKSSWPPRTMSGISNETYSGSA